MGAETIHHSGLIWTNIEDPAQEDIDYLRRTYPHFHPLDLEECLGRIQRPKIDEYEDYLFVVVHFPIFRPAVRRLEAAEMNIFIGPDYLVTVNKGGLRPLAQAFTDCQESEDARAQYMGRGSQYLFYRVIDGLVDYCFPILDRMSLNTENIEQMIFSGARGQQTLREIAIVRRNLINFRSIIKPQMSIIAVFERKDWDFLRGELDIYWGDILDHATRIWSRLEDLKEVIEGLSDTNEALTSHRLNEVMKILTIFSVIMLPLSVISGIYGMNIRQLPLARTSYAFPVITGFMIAIVLTMLVYFKMKDWM